MTVVKEGKAQASQGLRALDTDLPFLASEAAVDLDNILSGRGAKQVSAIHRLATRLKNSIELSNSGGSPKALMDPATLTVLGEAMAQAAGSLSPTKVEGVLSEAAKIADQWSAPELSQKREDLVRARDFCVALSKTAASYRRAIRELRPPHPFRR